MIIISVIIIVTTLYVIPECIQNEKNDCDIYPVYAYVFGWLSFFMIIESILCSFNFVITSWLFLAFFLYFAFGAELLLVSIDISEDGEV